MSYNPHPNDPANPNPILPGNSQFDHARDKVKPAAYLLIVSGVIGLLSGLLVGGYYATVSFFFVTEELKEQMLNQPNATPELVEISLLTMGWGGIITAIVSLIVGVIIIVGGMRMLAMRSWGLGLTASILSLVPCFQVCCLLSIPAGIYALVVLSDPQVKSAFK